MNLAKSTGVKTWEREDANLGPDLYRSYLKKKNEIPDNCLFVLVCHFKGEGRNFIGVNESSSRKWPLLATPRESVSIRV